MSNQEELENAVRHLMAYDIVDKLFSSLSGKAGRRKVKLPIEIARYLKENLESRAVVAYIEDREEQKSKSYKDAFDEFKKRYPDYADKLDAIYQDKDDVTNKYLIYGLSPRHSVRIADYIEIYQSIGLLHDEAVQLHKSVNSIVERLQKEEVPKNREILISPK